MPLLVTMVPMELMNVVAVVSTGVCELKMMLDAEPVADVLVAAAERTWEVVPARLVSVLSTAFSATVLTVAVDPVGSATVRSSEPTGGGGAGDGLGEGEGLGEGDGEGGGEQHRMARPTAPVTEPVQA
jgi:hypothetical protein